MDSVGAGLGSVCRFGIGQWVMRYADTRFPWGTLSVNLLACLVLGLIWLLIGKDTTRQPGWVAFGIIGFCGGFSTFSTFGFETLQLMRDGLLLYGLSERVIERGGLPDCTELVRSI